MKVGRKVESYDPEMRVEREYALAHFGDSLAD